MNEAAAAIRSAGKPMRPTAGETSVAAPSRRAGRPRQRRRALRGARSGHQQLPPADRHAQLAAGFASSTPIRASCAWARVSRLPACSARRPWSGRSPRWRSAPTGSASSASGGSRRWPPRPAGSAANGPSFIERGGTADRACAWRSSVRARRRSSRSPDASTCWTAPPTPPWCSMWAAARRNSLGSICRGGWRRAAPDESLATPVAAWLSVPIGVVTLAERFPEPAGGGERWFRAMVEAVKAQVAPFAGADRLRAALRRRPSPSCRHLRRDHQPRRPAPGSSPLQPRAGGRPVDDPQECRGGRRSAGGASRPRSARFNPASGPIAPTSSLPARPSCEAVQELWPCERVRVADRGLREGLLLGLIAANSAAAASAPRSPRAAAQSVAS